MKLIKTLTLLLSVILLTFAGSSCVPTKKSEGTGGYLDDTVITTKVKAALLAEKNLQSTEINVETFKGKVQLSGFVSSRKAVQQAIKVTRGVSGVKSVSNKMQVK
ncbi:BON domain-containing protein [Candidatus Williamhamiltonella defendens]|uniref:BON domain-containing protein n=1 Tax=Candidatus Williamhamiltonella defendens TaxID=138072 RepID=UPI00130ED885|nr:BON domain-containing protein [Candidatus Hamiltonella defensa]